MTKIAYNGCHGGFSLSEKAIKLGRYLSGDPMWGGACLVGDTYNDGTRVAIFYGGGRELDRTDATLIAVIEKLGNSANGSCASLKIREIDDGERYRIDEYDGYESVMTPADYTWSVA